MKLSILICSIESRTGSLNALLNNLSDQINNPEEIQILVEQDNGEMSIGKKRNKLLKRATGEYLCFVDDDDEVSAYYVKNILEAIKDKPDCVGIKLDYFVNGQFKGAANHTIKYNSWKTVHVADGIDFFERTPNHLNPIKSSIARLVKFQEIDRGEDHAWSCELYQYLKTEVEIETPIYKYKYRTKK